MVGLQHLSIPLVNKQPKTSAGIFMFIAQVIVVKFPSSEVPWFKLNECLMNVVEGNKLQDAPVF